MLRTRKNKRYNEEMNDEEDEGGRKYVLKDKISSERFEQPTDLHELPGDEVTLKLIQRNGFDKPILVAGPAGLDLTAPPEGFAVKDVGMLVGYDRLIDVMDVRTQKNIEMTMKQWCRYYESRNRDRLLNVISLEFSHTDLDDLVDSPKIVKQLDWVDLVWPKFLKESQTESTNKIDNMKYPKVQKYCLMSVKGSYTDFHIDFGGTSVWYHIIRGKKIFWMVPPTELNLQTFEEWTLSGMQQEVFFGDLVEQCFRVELSAGNTFFIPSGWIHAVYTVEDSLVFGGNFLHSFGIENQLKVARIEDATKVPLKFRYPFYTEMLWYVVQHYVYCLTGKSHLHSSAKTSATTTPEKTSKTSNHSKKNSKRSDINHDSSTESEQDDCDKTKMTKKKKMVVKPSPSERKRGQTTKSKPRSETPPHDESLKRKRGRPPKKGSNTKQPTDDESTEIDSDLEDVKPAKTNTCRMTKNSLLRLQYEIDEPKPATDRPSMAVSNKPLKSSIEPSDTCSKATAKEQNLPAKSQLGKGQTSALRSDECTKPDKSDDLTSSSGALRPNGWPSSQTDVVKSTWSNPDTGSKKPLKIHLTKYEVSGLKVLVKHLSKLSGAKKNMPSLIRNSRALLDDCKKIIAEHENDDPELAITGMPITPDMLIPKKTDINQLIEQFFKPEITVNGGISNDVSSFAIRSDSSSLTMKQRLKYNQKSDQTKIEDRKSSSALNDGTTHESAHKKTKCASPGKKSAISSACPPLSSSGNATTNSPKLPRPKSPPTRPLSNKQYASRTKSNDKVVAVSALPDSFAGLIAATSSDKVYDVNSADVTSSIFGAGSPSKSIPSPEEKDIINTISACPAEPQQPPALGIATPNEQNRSNQVRSARDTAQTLSTAKALCRQQADFAGPVAQPFVAAEPRNPPQTFPETRKLQQTVNEPPKPSLPATELHQLPKPAAAPRDLPQPTSGLHQLQPTISTPCNLTTPKSEPKELPQIVNDASKYQQEATKPEQLATVSCALPKSVAGPAVVPQSVVEPRPVTQSVVQPRSVTQSIVEPCSAPPPVAEPCKAPNAKPCEQPQPALAREAAPKSKPRAKSSKRPATQDTMPSKTHIRPPDNAALLSLATTALSTAPLPTTPTLSTIGARLPNPGHAYMVNPNMFAAQHYFNPYLQRMPMVHFAPSDPNPMAAMMAASHFRPSGIQRPAQPTTSQLLVSVSNQPGQPRYLITQPGLMAPRPQVAQMFAGTHLPTSSSFPSFPTSGFMTPRPQVAQMLTRQQLPTSSPFAAFFPPHGFMAPGPQVAQMFAGQQLPTSSPFATFPSPVGQRTAKEPVKVKKVKTR